MKEIEKNCGCYFPTRKGAKKWYRCDTAKDLFRRYLVTGKPKERKLYDQHFQR